MGLISRVSSRTYRESNNTVPEMLVTRALRFGLSRPAAAYAYQSERLEDWQNFKMPNAPYQDMGPLPPPPATTSDAGKTRLVYLQESYFKLLEPKLGYTGGYTLFWGAILTGLSKEWLIMGPEMYWLGAASVLYYFLFKNVAGPFIDREDVIYHDVRSKKINEWKQYKVSLAESEIDGIARLKEQTEGLAMIQEQRKVNLDLALDAEHMNRQADLVEAVKKRLDYQVAVNNAERDAHAKHMIKWIDAEVNAAIAKRSSKDDLTAAIAQLKSMAAK